MQSHHVSRTIEKHPFGQNPKSAALSLWRGTEVESLILNFFWRTSQHIPCLWNRGDLSSGRFWMHKWLNDKLVEKNILPSFNDDNLLRANARLGILGNTCQSVVYDKYGLHYSSLLILTLKEHKRISHLIRFIWCLHGIHFYHYH